MGGAKRRFFTALNLTSIIFVVCLAVFCIGKINLNNSKTPENRPTQYAETKGLSAKGKYWDSVQQSVLYKVCNELGGVKLGTTKITSVPKTPTHYATFGNVTYLLTDVSVGFDSITEQDTYYKISSAEEYKEFVKLTYLTAVNVDSIKQHGLPPNLMYPHGLVYYSAEKYLVFPFNETNEVEITVNYVVANGRTYFVNVTEATMETYGDLNGLSSVAGGTMYQTKIAVSSGYQLTVALMNDITITLNPGNLTDEQENIYFFAGVFDGQGNTITFNGSDKYYYANTTPVDGHDKAYSPFCSYLDNTGVIKNVKIDYAFGNDFLLIDNGVGATPSYAGGIVGSSFGQVVSCIVSNPRVCSHRYQSLAYYAALVAINKGSVSYCVVEGDYCIKAQGWNIGGNPDGIYAYWGSVGIVSNGVSKCLWNAKVEEIKVTKEDDDYMYTPADTSDDGKWTYSEETKESSCVNYYNGDESFNKLSSIGANGGKIGTYFYYTLEYNYLPKLRVFIDWRYINFKSSNPKQGIVSPSRIEVPIDAVVEGNKGSYEIIKVLGQTITSTPASGYRTKQWKLTSSDTYTVYFSDWVVCFKFVREFNETPQGGDIILSSSSSYGLNGLLYATGGSVIKVEIEYYNKDKEQVKSITYRVDGMVYHPLNREWRSDFRLTFKAKNSYAYLALNKDNRYVYEDFELTEGTETEPTIIPIGLVSVRKAYDVEIR